LLVVSSLTCGVHLLLAASLAAAGASVVIAVRRPEAVEEVAQDLRTRTANPDISVRSFDFADIRFVGRFVNDWDGPTHALVNNAGIMALPDLRRSSQGWETQFATNYLGHLVLTFELRRSLSKAQGGRVVSVSSSGSLVGPVFWDDPHFQFIPYDPLLAYAQSKTACTLLSVGIKQHWAADGIVSNALNPGAIATNLQR
jgi:NAD(P)-dependent dehydrogenase (short-subunit alcohol dehydrogenase family)